MIDLQHRPLQERYTHLLTVISSRRFQEMQGLGNEVPFFICPFRAEEHEEMYKLIGQLENQLKNNGIQVLNVNLYDLSIMLLKNRDILGTILKEEQDMTKDELKELLQNVLDPEQHLIPAIVGRMNEGRFDVMFITGVGKVFPYIRSHTVLNNLQSKAKDRPTIMFFPGEYKQSIAEGASLDLFGRLHDDKYYRAFNIYHYQI